MNSTASVPLTEALPWPSPPPSDGRFFLVCDSIETDGRFLLHTLASQVLYSQGCSVLWVACGPWTDQLIVAALKKMGCDKATTSRLRVRSVSVDMSTRILEENNDNFNVELYVKELHHFISSWIMTNGGGGGNWIVIDDVSSLATLVGERLTYCFVLSLRALAKRNMSCSIIMKCWHDFDMEILREQATTSIRAGGSRRHVDWVGAGGGRRSEGFGRHDHDDNVPWELTLPELADGIVNVEPLPSGYSREAHGRLVFVSQGRGWGQPNGKILQTQGTPNELIPLVMNFCWQDTYVSAIRLRRPVAKELT